MVLVKTIFPPEWDPHIRTYMAWPEDASLWDGVEKLKAVQEEIVRLAYAIVSFEPVTVLASPNKVEEAKLALGDKVTVLEIPVNDLWVRDTLPEFIFESTGGSAAETKLVGVDFNFNGWGNKQRYEADSKIASKILQYLNLERKRTDIISEGGALETDGAGTLLVTESSIINENRNPGKSKEEIENKLKELLGIKKVIWFKGVAGKDITDTHVDCIVRFISPGKVIISRPPLPSGQKNEEETDKDECDKNESTEDYDVWTQSSNEALEILRKETDANGNPFSFVKLYEPNIYLKKKNFISSYANYYVVNGGVIIPEFGDEVADAAAKEVLQNSFPNRKIVSVRIDTLASGGGGIHCATHDLPKFSTSVPLRD